MPLYYECWPRLRPPQPPDGIVVVVVADAASGVHLPWLVLVLVLMQVHG